MEFLKTPITSRKVREKGQKLYGVGKCLLFAGAIGFGLLLLIFLIVGLAFGGEDIVRIMAFNVASGYEFVLVLYVLALLGVAGGMVGVYCYFAGMSYFALGAIACNTEGQACADAQKSVNDDEIPEL